MLRHNNTQATSLEQKVQIKEGILSTIDLSQGQRKRLALTAYLMIVRFTSSMNGIRSRPLVLEIFTKQLYQNSNIEAKRYWSSAMMIAIFILLIGWSLTMAVRASLRAYYQIKVRRTVIVDSQSIKTTEVAQEVGYDGQGKVTSPYPGIM